MRAEFPSIKHNIKRECAQKRFFRGLNECVQEMFYGKVCIKGDVTEKRITLPEPVEKYRMFPRNLEVDKDRVRKLTDDALKGADKDIDFSRYFFVVIFLGAKLTEYGMIGICVYPAMLGLQAGRLSSGTCPPPGISSWSKLSSAGLPMTG